MTWNVWWRFGDWEPRQNAIQQVLKEVDADIVCLQEVWSSEDGEDQVRNLATSLGMHYARTPEKWWKGHSFGNAILSKYPITKTECEQLPPLDLSLIHI